MEKYIKTEISGLVRDIQSGAIINIDNSEYKSILSQRNKKKEIDKLQQDVAELSSSIGEIKSLLKQIITNGKINE